MISDQLTVDSVIQRSDALLSSRLGDDFVMMDVEQGDYYGMEEVAARIWALTENPISAASVCEQLQMEYSVSPEQCHQEVIAFLKELLHRKIVQVLAQQNLRAVGPR